jgi:sterol 24-C-methyltransferase
MTTSVASKFQFKLYRLMTVLKSFKTIYTLPQEKVDTFLNSYDIFNHDWVNEDELIEKMGKEYYNEVQKKLVDYYSVLNHLCALGQVEKMYIPPALDLSKSIIENQKLYEQKMCNDLGIQPGDKVLDIGCGRGRVASHVASYSGAEVVGMNLDPGQLESAKRFAEGNGLWGQCQFVRGDMNQLPLPFADSSFNFIYHIQAFSYAKDLGQLFKDIYRMLKPGGKVACLDWATLDKYDPENPHHADLIKRIKPLIGAIGTPSVEDYVKAMQGAGFEVCINENASIDGLQAPLIENADKFFTRMSVLIKAAVNCKILPKHFLTLFNRLTQDGQAFVEADRLRLVTTSHYWVAQKN